MGKHFINKLLSGLAVLVLFGCLQGYAPETVQADDDLPITSVDAPAPVIEPTVENENNDTKVLFDNTHGQTAGAADWVINGAFSDFGEAIAGEGYYVEELRQTTPITYEDLADYQVFVIPEANIPFKDSEQAAILQFVENGGSVFYIADHYNADRNLNRWDSGEIFNGYRRGAFDNPTKGFEEDEVASEAMQGVSSSDWLADHFGVRFRFNAIGDGVAEDIVAPSDSFGITQGVEGVAFHAGATIAVTDPAKAKGLVYVPEGVSSWGPAVDQGVYNGGGRDEGAFVAISKAGQGKAAFIGDSSPVEDSSPIYLREDTGRTKTTYDGFEEADDGVLLTNLINWLAEQEDYADFNEQDIPLDEPTELHDFEIPENSTEPEAEPWSNPPSGYEWYDRTTFQPGSYGSGEEVSNPEYQLQYQDNLPGEMQEFQIRFIGENLGANGSESDFRLGIYLDGGQQVAQFSLDGETWSSNYGYSDYFTLNADQQGYASKTLYVRIKSGVSGEANLRVKQGSSNLLTETVTIDPDAVPEELPDEETPELPAIAPIDQVRALEDGELATIQGTVTSASGLWGAKGFYVQDETAGIYVYQSAQDVNPGDIVQLTGTTETYNGEKELLDIQSFEIVGSEEVPSPVVIGPEELSSYQGSLVQLEAVEITDLQKADNYGTTEFTAINAAGEAVVVRLDNRTGTDYDAFPFQNGDVVSITGLASVFKGTYQLKPRSIDDFAAVERKSISQLIGESDIQPGGIKTALLAKVKKAEKNSKHYDKLVHFISKQPDKHIPSDVKAELNGLIETLR
ncbi:DUF5689 domain-containing protein [Virgibacillus senegalensis]|uniref:DUF5689 domain-containing protein n=1 Tax=Virgibacillus senegalensis TaxID=1499679 RepID=UPI00069EFB59|nr:DUF5689 domain-containing protein [Virgibacillus senegalensis]